MVIGVLRAELALDGPQSLKDKRRIVKSLLDRAQRHYRVAAAEVDQQDSWRRAVLGFACVSARGDHAQQILHRLVGWIERETDAHLIDYSIEIL
jgi:uncharacterized protein YlxP (DUF503 family)